MKKLAYNFEVSSRASHIKGIRYFWSNNESILSSWIRERYIQGKAFSDLIPSPSRDSTMWKTILKHRDVVGKLLICGSDYNLALIGSNHGSSLQNFCKALSPLKQVDLLAEGLWTRKPTKFLVLLWRLRWGFLPSFCTLGQWGVPAPPFCPLR